MRIGEQLADWSAAIEFAGTLPGVDRDRIALWSFSISSGHVLVRSEGNGRVAHHSRLPGRARALNPGNRYPDWQQAAAARSVLGAGSYRPGWDAAKVRCPLLVVVCEQDQSVPVEVAVRVARQAPRGELVRLPGGHYAPFLGAHDLAVDAELAFLRRNLLGTGQLEADAANQPLTEPEARPAT